MVLAVVGAFALVRFTFSGTAKRGQAFGAARTSTGSRKEGANRVKSQERRVSLFNVLSMREKLRPT